MFYRICDISVDDRLEDEWRGEILPGEDRFLPERSRRERSRDYEIIWFKTENRIHHSRTSSVDVSRRAQFFQRSVFNYGN